MESGFGHDVEAFEVDIGVVRESAGLRLDASHYNATLVRAMQALRETGMALKTLGEVTSRIFIPPRFRRIYVEQQFGLPFVQGSHLVHFQPAGLKYISKRAHRDIEQWVIREGWVLVTRSGTVGRVMLAPTSWDGWGASEHIMRIVPKKSSDCPSGYLYAFLRSFVGQAQLTSRIYGAVVDEITENHARSIRIPIPASEDEYRRVREIDRLVKDSVAMRESAKALDVRSLEKMRDLLRTATPLASVVSDAAPPPETAP